jgi:hypothetical protein
MGRVGSSQSEHSFPADELADRLDEAEATGSIPASEEATSDELADRLDEAEATGSIPASEEATSFSMPAIDEAPSAKISKGQISSLGSERNWRKKAFGALLVLGSLVPSALIGVMLWLGAVKLPKSEVIVDRYATDPAETQQASMETLEAKTTPSKVGQPSVVMNVPDTLQGILGEEIPFGITMDSNGPLPPRAIITVEGMPDGAAFSAGRPYGHTGWTFRPDEVAANLSLIPSKSGKADLHIELVTADGVTIASASSHVDIMTDPKSTLVLRPEESGRIDELLAHGHKMVEVGYLAGARAYFRRAAEAGSADAALALGETYDQDFIDSIGAHGIKADLAQARAWYERAQELGSQEAKAKLGRVDAAHPAGEAGQPKLKPF